MIIPKKLKIIGFEWQVKESQEIADEGACFGSTHTQTQTIYLEKKAPIQKKEQVLLHEILHALWWQQGLGIRFKDEKKIEEEVITTLSQGLYQVLKDNNLLK